jgi:D-glycero-alpha-D-manno-heptose-7-phosphate kinase
MTVSILARAPTRIDLSGGTLDLWPISNLLEKKSTINIAIDLFAQAKVQTNDSGSYQIKSLDQDIIIEGDYLEVTRSPKLLLLSEIIKHFWDPKLPALSLETSAQSPQGAGLGGSSALAVATLGAILQLRNHFEEPKKISRMNLVKFCRNIESKVIHSPTGTQDYWAAIQGGCNVLTYEHLAPEVHTSNSEFIHDLYKHIIVCYSGQSRNSSLNNWQVYKNVFDKDDFTLKTLENIGSLSKMCANSLAAQELEQVLDFSRLEWEQRLELWPDIETARTREINNMAVEKGAWFSRVCGAGGGGCMIILCPTESKESISEFLQQNNVAVLSPEIASNGLEISEQ